MAIDLALDALSAFVPGGPVATRSLSLAAKAGRGAKKISAGGKLRKAQRRLVPLVKFGWVDRDTQRLCQRLTTCITLVLRGASNAMFQLANTFITAVIHEFDDYTIIGGRVME